MDGRVEGGGPFRRLLVIPHQPMHSDTRPIHAAGEVAEFPEANIMKERRGVQEHKQGFNNVGGI